MNARTINPLALALTAAAAFHFRGISMLPHGTPGGRTKAQETEFAAHADQFETVESRIKNPDTGKVEKVKQYKRKSVETTITYPDFLLELTDAATQALVKNAVDRYVKLSYIDNFLPVGAHNWATVGGSIVDAFNNNNASAGSAPDDTVLAAAQLVWNTVIVQLAPALAATSADWIAKGCTDAGIRKMLGGNVTEPRLRKIAERVAQVAAVLATPEGTEFANAAPAFAYAADRIESIIGKMATLDDDAL